MKELTTIEPIAIPDINKTPYRVIVGRNVGWLIPGGNLTRVVQSNDLQVKIQQGVYGAKSTGHFALSLGLFMLPAHIYLLGFDCMVKTNNKPNFFDSKKVKGYIKNDNQARYNGRMLKGFDKFKNRKNIINCSMESAITIFPKKPIGEVLQDGRN